MAAVVGADSEAEPDASESEFEPDKEAQAESEVASLPLHAWPCVKAWLQADLDSKVDMPTFMSLRTCTTTTRPARQRVEHNNYYQLQGLWISGHM